VVNLCPTVPRGPHLEVLPAAAAGQVLHDEAVLGADRGPILLPAGVAPAPATVAATFRGDRKAGNLPLAIAS